MEKYIQNFMRCFSGKAFINAENEMILDLKENVYFRLENVENETDLKCKVLAWISKPAQEGTTMNCQKRLLKAINCYLKTNFSKANMRLIYIKLGNDYRSDLSIKFIESGYDLKILNKE